MKVPALLTALAGAVLGVGALTPDEWTRQSVYQVLTDRFARTDGSTSAPCGARDYCGGTWRGLINHLDYIQGMGFSAVWISPVVENIEGYTAYGEAYHGYWAQDIYALNPHYGTEQDLRDLSDALHSRGMYLMVDVVTNHMGYNGCGACVDYSIYTPFDSASYYHPYCPIDYNDQNSVVTCWQGDNQVSLPDLRTEDANVRTVWNDWIRDLVANYSIDGLRVDSVKHVEKSFWPDFEAASGVYNVGEVLDGDPAIYPDWQKHMSGLMNYPIFYFVTRAFQSTSATMDELYNGINTMKDTVNTTLLGSFLENHDQKRFPALTGDMALAKNAIAFTLLADGIPIVYQGQEQHFAGADDPANREALWPSGYDTTAPLYRHIRAVNALRRHAAAAAGSAYTAYQAHPVHRAARVLAVRKGAAVSLFTNAGAGGAAGDVALPADATGAAPGQAYVDALACRAYTADAGTGALTVQVGSDPVVLYPAAGLEGSGICSGETDPPAGPSSVVDTPTQPTASCAPPTAVAVTFDHRVTTSVGETIKITGNIAALGNWDPDRAVRLDASRYSAVDPLWSATVPLAPGAAVQYKFIKVGAGGAVAWEADPNRAYTVPASCATAATVSGSWR